VASGDRIRFELSAGDLTEADLAVVRVAGTEAISEPYRFEVEVVPRSGEPLDLAALVGAEAVLAIRRPDGAERLVHGEALRVELAGVAAGVPRYRLAIGPRLARLAHVARSRLFQGRSVPQIVGDVLGEHGVSHRLALSGSSPARDLVVQRRETDLAFVSRLLEAEGIWYRFEHSGGGHELVLGDASGALAERDGSLPLRPETGQGDGEEHLARLVRSRRVTSTRAVRRDFDFERPTVDLTAAEGDGPLEVYEWPGGHRDAGEGRRLARARLEALRHGEETVEGAGNAVGVVPGTKLEVEGEGALAIVRAWHEGEQERAAGGAGEVRAAYANRFEAIPADRPLRPRRRTPVPRAAGIETATVVGPAGEEIHTDAHGRVKVLFRWDREGTADDRASCWVRVAQGWAGVGMGASFVPRIGQEVVIRFLDGDPDRPIVAGAVYNGANAVPVVLPDEKTRSALRSASSPGGDGANELRLEDAAGAEEVFLHAQKDEQVAVERDAAAEVRAGETLEVQKDRAVEVAGNQALAVTGNDAAEVGGNRTVVVGGRRDAVVLGRDVKEVGGSDSVAAGGSRDVTVADAVAETIGAAATLAVGGGYVVNVAGVLNEAVGGLRSAQIGGAAAEVVVGSREETVGKDRAVTTQGDVQAHVDGELRSSVGTDAKEEVGGAEGIAVEGVVVLLAKSFAFEGDQVSIVVNGKRALEMKRSGAVAMAGAAVTLEASGALAMKGASVKKVSPAPPPAASPQVRRLEAIEDPRGKYEFTLVDADGKPVVNEPFRVELPDGKVKHGRTDGSGKASLPGPRQGTAKVTFPKIDGRAIEEGR
jgi:type VI secretion system secreted protein VgrG